MNRGDTEQLLSQLQLHGVQPPTWRDPRKVATHEWLPGALDHIWQGGTGDDDESADGAVECVQLELSSPHPEFYGIVRIDDVGIWYADSDTWPEHVYRIYVIPWHQVVSLQLNRAT